MDQIEERVKKIIESEYGSQLDVCLSDSIYADYEFDSLKTMMLIAHIEDDFKIELDDRVVFRCGFDKVESIIKCVRTIINGE